MKHFCMYAFVFRGTHVDTHSEKKSSPKNPTLVSEKKPFSRF